MHGVDYGQQTVLILTADPTLVAWIHLTIGGPTHMPDNPTHVSFSEHCD